jgi:hypothetical protein
MMCNSGEIISKKFPILHAVWNKIKLLLDYCVLKAI